MALQSDTGFAGAGMLPNPLSLSHCNTPVKVCKKNNSGRSPVMWQSKRPQPGLLFLWPFTLRINQRITQDLSSMKMELSRGQNPGWDLGFWFQSGMSDLVKSLAVWGII